MKENDDPDGEDIDPKEYAAKMQSPDASEPSEEGYHHVISCSGWSFDRSIFDESVMPDATAHKNYEGKFPALNHRFESVSVPGLFFVGTPMHGHDYKKAAGGFIHGFRYLIRSMHRILEQDDEETQTPWPKLEFDDVKQVKRRIHQRLNTMSGPYQMFGHLADVVIVTHRVSDNDNAEPISKFIYREEVPVKYLQNVGSTKWCREELKKGAETCGVIQLTLEYGHDPRPIGQRDPFAEDRVGFTGETSHFLHPVFRVYEAGAVLGQKADASSWFSAENRTQLAEQPLTDWDRPEFHEDVTSLFRRTTERQVGWLLNRSGKYTVTGHSMTGEPDL